MNIFKSIRVNLVNNNLVNYFLLFSIISVILLFSLDIILYGSGISGDTRHYLLLAGKVNQFEFPNSGSYLPAFPILVGFLAKIFSIKIFQSAIFWMIIFYITNLIFIYKIADYLIKKYDLSKTAFYLFLFILISWWSFRIQKATHADAMYYSLLILLTYFTIKSFFEVKTKNFIIIGVILSFMVITKYNSYILLILYSSFFFFKIFNVHKNFTYFVITIMPSTIMIFLWKVLNGKFIYAFNRSNYQDNNFDFFKVVKIMYLNISDFGKNLIEIFISPLVGRLLNEQFGFVLGLFSVLYLVYLTYLYRKLKISFIFLLSSIIYLFALIFLQSLNLLNEINTRTLLTFYFFLFISISFYLIVHKKQIILLLLFITLFLNNFLMLGKWLYETSSKNSFKYEYNKEHSNFYNSRQFQEIIKNYKIMSNEYQLILFTLNYQKEIASITTDRLFYKGKFKNIDSIELNNVLIKMKNFVENNGIVIFSNSKSLNDKLIIKDMSSKFYSIIIKDDLIIISKSKLNF